MLEQLNAMEVEAMLQYTPDREPTVAELKELEKETPNKRQQLFALLDEPTTDRTPGKKIILNEEINSRYNYKRVIFNDWETIIDLNQDPSPRRVRKQELIIKIRSEMAELKQDIQFAQKQLERLQWHQRAKKRVNIRATLRDALKHKAFLARKIEQVKLA